MNIVDSLWVTTPIRDIYSICCVVKKSCFKTGKHWIKNLILMVVAYKTVNCNIIFLLVTENSIELSKQLVVAFYCPIFLCLSGNNTQVTYKEVAFFPRSTVKVSVERKEKSYDVYLVSTWEKRVLLTLKSHFSGKNSFQWQYFNEWLKAWYNSSSKNFIFLCCLL